MYANNAGIIDTNSRYSFKHYCLLPTLVGIKMGHVIVILAHCAISNRSCVAGYCMFVILGANLMPPSSLHRWYSGCIACLCTCVLFKMPL